MEVNCGSGKKLEAPVTLFSAIEAKQHEALREIAFLVARVANGRGPIQLA